MRSEQEMMDLILGVAKRDERVRAVTLEGSRTNPNVPKDVFQDYDISFHVTDMDSFIQDPGWIDVFGERIILQTPEDMAMFPPDLGNWFSYLMLFTDGNRIDMTLIPIEEKESYSQHDKLIKVLMDKDGTFPEIPEPSDEDYRVKRPSAEFFADCSNEFWWVTTYVAKGLWREEILYAQDHLNNIVRPMLIKMLEWQAGVLTGFSLSVGKNAKYLKRYLPEDSWNELMDTYAGGTYDEVWDALFAAGALFRKTALYVGEQLGYTYDMGQDGRVTGFLHHVRQLPRDAKEIY
ncbi:MULTISPECIES: aminoglycoside 6-adenylyltransferase [Paenibacillus]|uniref:Adenylyltransferase n=2 Tax=Paenibacillus lactis TaxID=228574 RepID=G4HPH9_9BACL|nr:aminoglycoside 6-adenylyltransferase [Paenibacillus lactis]EHB47886.1 adenylyltransferase [Paenibacillus lactis 154]MBP1896665.1 aminoglycoside 6-adenylyltransferase [Paenibacillus lactis]HAG01070.1 aminoglycoside 6-adenylyltransferase [Paenibacillus lactis]